MKISTGQKLDNFRNMRSMIKDYSEQYSRYPTNKEMEEKLEMSEATVKRYKHVILQETKNEMLKQFNEDVVFHVRFAINEINKNIELFKIIREQSDDENTKMTAAKNIEEAHLDIVRIMNDAPEYISDNNGNDIPENEQEHIHRKNQTEKITDGISKTFR